MNLFSPVDVGFNFILGRAYSVCKNNPNWLLDLHDKIRIDKSKNCFTQVLWNKGKRVSILHVGSVDV